MTLRSVLRRAALIAAAGAVSLGGVLTAAPAPAAAQAAGVIAQAGADDAVVTLDAELSDAPLSSDGTVTLTFTVTNATSAAVPSGTIAVTSATAAFTGRDDLSSFLDASNATTSALTPTALDTLSVPTVAAGESWTSTPLQIPADSFDFPDAFGAYGLAGLYQAGNAIAESRDAVVYAPDDESVPEAVSVTVVMPLTVPDTVSGLLDADTLAAYTAEDGVLTAELDGAYGRDIALGVDPRIIASIRALGSSAPESAVEWLDRLETAPNQTFALQYADADPTAQIQAGFDGLMQPTSLAYGTDPDDFASLPEETPTQENPVTTPDAQGTEEPDPEPTASVDENGVPTLESLLAFDYTIDDLVWPDADTVTTDDLSAFAASGLTTIVSTSNTAGGDTTTVSASATAGDADVLVADSAASAQLQRAVTADGDTEQDDALASLSAELAVMASEPGATARTILLTLDRETFSADDASDVRLDTTMSRLGALSTSSLTTLTSAMSSPSTAVEIADEPQADDRVAAFSSAVSRDDEIASFASVLSDPTILIGRQNATQLALFSVGWRADAEAWDEATTAFTTATDETLHSVSIVRSSQITMIANQISIKISVRNDLDLPVEVVLTARPDNPRLTVEPSELTEIPANSQATVSIPVTSRLGNGDVNLGLALHSATGVSVAAPSSVAVSVRADWEVIGTVILVSAVVLLLVAGTFRTVRRRRRERAVEESAEADAADAGTVEDAPEAASDAAGDSAPVTSADEPGTSAGEKEPNG